MAIQFDCLGDKLSSSQNRVIVYYLSSENNMLQKIAHIVRSRGVSGLLRTIINRLTPCQPLKYVQDNRDLFRGKTALEVGGPSPVFREGNLFPIYPLFAKVDSCNFGATTVWEGEISQGQTFQADTRCSVGHQYVMEASDLSEIQSEQYDCFISSHALEHVANPLKALSEWIRVTKEGGTVVLVLPHKEGTFDHRRPVTTLEHLIADAQANVTEHDLTHLPEILELHDFKMDSGGGTHDAFKVRSERNHENRCLHHHVFDSALVAEMLDYCGLRIKMVECALPCHIFVVAEKMVASDSNRDNTVFLRKDASYRVSSPFTLDRKHAS
jgi:SAM-dependent methyltransferase